MTLFSLIDYLDVGFLEKEGRIQQIFEESVGDEDFEKYFSIVAPGRPGGTRMDLNADIFRGFEVFRGNPSFDRSLKYKGFFYEVKDIDELIFILENSQLFPFLNGKKIPHINDFTRNGTEDFDLTRVKKVRFIFSQGEIEQKKFNGQFYVSGFEIEDSHQVELVYIDIDQEEGARALFLKNKEGEIYPFFSYSE